MPIRFVDRRAYLGRLAAVLDGAQPLFSGSHVAPPARTGVIGTQLAGGVMSAIGGFTLSSNRTGVIAPVLDGGVFVILASFGGGNAGAFDYYIGPNGSDSNPGTSVTQPWALTAINTKRALYAGKTVGFLDGTYDVQTLYGPPPAGADPQTPWMRVSGGPSNAQRTVFRALNRHQAILDANRNAGTATLAAMIGGQGSSSSNFTLDGFKLTRGNHMALVHDGVQNWTIANCWFYDNAYTRAVGSGQNSGNIRGLNSGNVIVDNCFFELFDAPADSGRTAAIQWINNGAGTNVGVSDSEIRNSTAVYTGTSSAANGWHIKNPGSNRNKIIGTYVEMAAGNPVLWHGNSQNATGREIFRHNVLVARGELGLLCGEDVDSVLVPFDVYNNTFVGAPDFKTCGLRMFATASQVNSWNNIFSRTTVGFRGDYELTNTGTYGLFDYNLYADANPSTSYKTGSGATAYANSLTEFRSLTGSTKEMHSVEAVSAGFLLTGTRANRFRLAGNSPGVDMGSTDGTTGGTECDVGAFGNGAPAIIGCDYAQ